MLEGLVAWVLNNYLGKYVENLNTDQLSVALLSGKVELENLPLKKDALCHLDLPVEVKAGFIGKVQLQVPVSQIRSAPWIIAIEKLYVVIAPVNLDEWDGVTEANIAHERKVALLDALEAQWRAEHETSDANYYATSYSSWLSYGTGLLANIVENLQLKLKDVHIRYEDSLTCERPFACGVTVESLTAESCDGDWQRGFTLLSADSECSFKLMELQQLAVYWDPVSIPTGLLANYTLAELINRMSSSSESEHVFILRPSSASARVRRVRCDAPLRARARPRYHVALTLDNVQLAVTDSQYSEALECSEGLSRISRWRGMRSHRPMAKLSDDVVAWWKYAVKAHLPHHHWMDPKPTWESCLQRVKEVKQYVDTCLLILTQPAATLAPQAKRAKDDFEFSTSLEILKALRECAMRLVPASVAVGGSGSVGRSALVRWFPQWWGWHSPPPASAPPPLEDEILDVIADSLENNSVFKRDAFFAHFNFLLNKGSLTLTAQRNTDQSGSEVVVGFGLVCVSVSSRPRGGSFGVSLSLGEFTITSSLHKDALVNYVVAPQGVISEKLSSLCGPSSRNCSSPLPTPSSEPLLYLEYENKPYGCNSDYRLFVKSQSLEVVYSEAVVQWASQWLTHRPKGYYTADIMHRWEHIIRKHQSDRRSWLIELDICAPLILISPGLVLASAQDPLLMIDFGRLTLTNARECDAKRNITDDVDDDDEDGEFLTPCSTPPGSLASPSYEATNLPTANQLRDSLYDTYKIELSDLQVLVGKARDYWKYSRSRSTSALHLLDRFSILMQMERRVVPCDDAQFPSLTLNASLPSLVVHCTEHKLSAVHHVLSSCSLIANRNQPRSRASEQSLDELSENTDSDKSETSDQSGSSSYLLQFAVDQISMEIVSRGRSVCELQVVGGRWGARGRERGREREQWLSVHSLLLVDALQTYGPDCELLLASHRHLNLDCSSGSILGSEPTSPGSPAEPSYDLRPLDLTHHHHNVNPGPSATLGPNGMLDSEALIAVEVIHVRGEDGHEDICIANILFNTLDVIANQETISELVDFAHRIFGSTPSAEESEDEPDDGEHPDQVASAAFITSYEREIRTEVTFDFHRLGVLLLRATEHGAEKVATATLSDAKIQATIDKSSLVISGSLGGVQVVSLELLAHSCLLLVGHSSAQINHNALQMHFTRDTLIEEDGPVHQLSGEVCVARVWVTCCVRSWLSLVNCLHSLLGPRGVARASHVARHLVAHTGDTLYMNPRMSQSTESMSPNRRTFSTSIDDVDWAAAAYHKLNFNISVTLESPVCVVPESSSSGRVLLAHPGHMTLKASNHYLDFSLRDVALYTLDISSVELSAVSPQSMPLVYDAAEAKPILHNTAIAVQAHYQPNKPKWEISGRIVEGLQVSCTQQQYELLLATLKNMDTSAEAKDTDHDNHSDRIKRDTSMSCVGEVAVPTLRLEPALRAHSFRTRGRTPTTNTHPEISGKFEVQSLVFDLRGMRSGEERSLVQLSCKQLHLDYNKTPQMDTDLQVSVKSVLMEDLGSGSSSSRVLLRSEQGVKLNPRLRRKHHSLVHLHKHSLNHSLNHSHEHSLRRTRSLPALRLNNGEQDYDELDENESLPSAMDDVPSEDTLVTITITTRHTDSAAIDLHSHKVIKHTKVDFNWLHLVINIESWITVLDFFGLSGVEPDISESKDLEQDTEEPVSVANIESEFVEVSEFNIRRVDVVLVKNDRGLCKGRLDHFHSSRRGLGLSHVSEVGCKGVRVMDLSPRPPPHATLLATTRVHVLYTRYDQHEAAKRDHEVFIDIDLAPLKYVHTARFVANVNAFLSDCAKPKHVLEQARKRVLKKRGECRRSVRLKCSDVTLLVPVSSSSLKALHVHIAHLNLHNGYVQLPTTDGGLVWCEQKRVVISGGGASCYDESQSQGQGSILQAPLQLNITFTTPIETDLRVAQQSIRVVVNRLEWNLSRRQFKLIKGLIAHNLADSGEEPQHVIDSQIFTSSSLVVELSDVSVRVFDEYSSPPLAFLNFISSKLTIETYSDGGRDIDLVSKEILLTDSRYSSEPANRRKNVFSNIVCPLQQDTVEQVQVEVHARVRANLSSYTIIVNKMRLMAIFDWWEAWIQYIMETPLPANDHHQLNIESEYKRISNASPFDSKWELKLNISDSQVVLVQDASVWDTNALILKSCSLVRRSSSGGLVWSLSELELFSCILGLEEETALHIVEKCSVQLTLNNACLQLCSPALKLRLSYHDMIMFAAMLSSLPKQMQAALAGKLSSKEREDDAPANLVHLVRDQGRIRMGPLVKSNHNANRTKENSMWPIHTLKVRCECFTLSVIDDCLDSDVPLLDVTLREAFIDQDLRSREEPSSDPKLVLSPCEPGPMLSSPGSGKAGASLSIDYYNRLLSGWEPFVEPWRFECGWEYQLTGALRLARLQVDVTSSDVLNTNITSALLELAQLVRTNWTEDYYSNNGLDGSPKGSPCGVRRRSPFVPYALKNLTGQKLWATTIPHLSERNEASSGLDDSWWVVKSGGLEPFSWRGHKGQSTHTRTRLALRLDGWTPPHPLPVHRVGTFFRNIHHAKTGAKARLVVEVTLEGSAQKLVTVRSALQVYNCLPHSVEIRVDTLDSSASWRSSAPAEMSVVAPNSRWACSLRAVVSCLGLSVRPLPSGTTHSFAALQWKHAKDKAELQLHESTAPPDKIYRFSSVVVRELFPPDRGEVIAGHTLRLVPALRLENLLPVEMHYRAISAQGVVAVLAVIGPSESAALHHLNVDEGFELSLRVEGFCWSGGLAASSDSSPGFTARLKMADEQGRRLYLNARLTINKNEGMKVTVWCSYWVVNRLGMPLVVGAGATSVPSAGQGQDHEVGRTLTPLMFSFADPDSPPTISLRLGNKYALQPEWCSPFGLGGGELVKRLEWRGAGGGVAWAGVVVRSGRGRHRLTTLVVVRPRYLLYNDTANDLQLAQDQYTDLPNGITLVSPGSQVAWHWPKAERSRLMRIRLALDSNSYSAWSGAFSLDNPKVLHLMCKSSNGPPHLVLVRVSLRQGSLLCTLSDGHVAPPPLKICNYSPVPLIYNQRGVSEEFVSGAHSVRCVPLPEPELPRGLSLRAPGGPRLHLSLEAHSPTSGSLTYQNFVYVAFATPTAQRERHHDSEQDEDTLVLEVPLGTTRVQLARKRYGERSQLWRMLPGGLLMHEGSSPPLGLPPSLPPSSSLLLDISPPAPRPPHPSPLSLRRRDPRRVSTQSWRHHKGRLLTAHSNMCLQTEHGLMDLRPGGNVVLGVFNEESGPPPPWQSVCLQSLRPGSGKLKLTVHDDGPTKTVTITDENDPEACWLEGEAESPTSPLGEWGVKISLRGLGLSLVGGSVELLHVHLYRVVVSATRSQAHSLAMDLAVEDMQWDNQLEGSPSPVLLYCLRETEEIGPAMHWAMELSSAPKKYNALYFSYLVVTLRPIAVRLEERLLLTLCQWALVAWGGGSEERADEEEVLLPHLPHSTTTCYFGLLQVVPSQIRLSMFTANKLDRQLSVLKRRLGLTLIRFEDANVELQPFVRRHPYETVPDLARTMLKHFRDELKWQAAKILGSVDFLGNPLGFVADVSEGVSGLIYEGNIGALVKNVTHGISNSAAKVSESLSDGLERVVLDEAHEETRRRIRPPPTAPPHHHLSAGVRKLGLGILGGMTSLVKHSYEGAAAEGLPGLVAGMGKGLVGTLTKPVIGVLDLAAHAATAIRDSSRRRSSSPLGRIRPPLSSAWRGEGSSSVVGLANQLLNALHLDHPERVLHYQLVRADRHDCRALLSDSHLRIITCRDADTPHVLVEAHLDNIVSCSAVSSGDAHFVELGLKGSGGAEALRRPRVQCDSFELAEQLQRQVALAKDLHYEERHTLQTHPDLAQL